MKRVLYVGVTLGLVAIIVAVQSRPSNYKLKSGSAEWMAQGRALNDVRAAILKILVDMDWQILDDAGTPGSINATKNIPAVFDPIKRPKLQIGATADYGYVTVRALWYLGEKGQDRIPREAKGEPKKFYDEFFAKLAEALK